MLFKSSTGGKEQLNQEQPEPLLTLDQLAAYLSVPKSWVYGQTRIAKKTKFPVTKVGKYCRFDRYQVMAWLEKQGE